MSRKSVLSRRASSLVEPELPLRTYFLSVGGALLLLILVANWVLPAPLPSRHTDSRSMLPPIRIHTELRGPEAVVIDTNQPAAVLAMNVNAEDLSQSAGADVIDANPSAGSAELDVGDAIRSVVPSTSRLRESLAEFRPAAADPAASNREDGGVKRPAARKPARPLREKLRRSIRRPNLNSYASWCASSNRERGSCHDAFTPFQMN
ncbi:hypothetical protein JQ596_09140 [Bradyrhizobium manausense]|uniref:hypothetical protein n=1 Tax=Bradyrhizobium TaxID=374 RepID=UPI001BA5301A|nr:MULTISPECIES: hypothetical protein [Bradyrhizobium]MBR0825702.1 hypothetical protein [Bradyrhizobium manausense]UVO31350.1 hypothetical protein KUF59_12205 [Bradyrhizobium arachidis]